MKKEDAKIGMVVRSNVNTLGVHYRIEELDETGCLVSIVDHPTLIYNDVPYDILEPVK